MSLLGGEVWYVALDSWASTQKGIKFNEALDNAFIFYNFDQGKKNMLAQGEKLGWSQAQTNEAEKLFGLVENEMDIDRRTRLLKGYEKDIQELDTTFGAGSIYGMSRPEERKRKVINQINASKHSLDLLNKNQEKKWNEFVLGKSEEAVEEDLGSIYTLAEDRRRDELISQRDEDKRKVYPYMSDIWSFFPSVWSPWDTAKEKYKLQGLTGFLPSSEKGKELTKKMRARGESPWLVGKSDADLAAYNKERGFRTKEELQGPLTNYEMSDILGRNKYLDFMYNHASGGRAGFTGGGIASLTRTTPPERGPQYRGLAYLRKHGRKY